MQTYSHSGIVPATGGLATALAGLAAAGIAGFLYAFAFYWMPIGILRLVLLGVYCLAVGISIQAVANSTKVRSPFFVTTVAVVSTLFGLWIYWGAYRVAKDGFAVGIDAWSPAELVSFGQRLFEDGSFKLRRHTIDGWPLVAFWVAEAGTMLFSIVGLARADAHRPFCESCEAWTNEDKTALRFAATGNEPAWAQILAGGDFAELGRFETATADTPEHVRLNVASCPKCAHSNFLTIHVVRIVTNRKGKQQTNYTVLLRNGSLTDTQAEMLRALAKMLGTPEDPPVDEWDELADELE